MFSDTLAIALDLTTQDETFSVTGASITGFSAQLLAYGFEGTVEFLVSTEKEQDSLLQSFVKPDPIQARLSISGVINLPDPKPDPLVITGMVTEKTVSEETYTSLKGEPVLHRRYTLTFMDNARVLWRQHFPTVLAADATMGDVIKRQIVEGISLEMSWPRLKLERPMVCLGLGEARASFYDFLMWYVDRFDGVFYLDYAEGSFQLSDRKPGRDEVGSLRGTQVKGFKVVLPETNRYNERVLNASTEASRTVEVTRDKAVDGVFQDILVRTPVASDVDDRRALESTRLKTRLPELAVAFKEYPDVPFWPGTFTRLQPEDFSSRLLYGDDIYRTYRVEIEGRAGQKEIDAVLDTPHQVYDLELTAFWENADDPVVKLPTYQDPRYPIFVEGKILCDMGEDGDRSYMIFSDDATAQHFYKVQVPLWNQQIMVPFGPHFTPGHFYIPAYKDSRVLLGLYFDRAEVMRFLDWGRDVQLPAESQGNHILFGKNKTSETSAKHVYVDSKPVFSIQRINNGDIELLQIKEGSIVLETREDESLKEGEARFDLSPKVVAARAKLSMDAKSGIAQITGGFEKASGALKGEIEDAVNQTKGALEGMGEEIDGKIDEITGEMEAAVGQLSQKAAALQGSAQEATAELKQKMKL